MDSQINWKIRTETIDQIAQIIKEKMVGEPLTVVGQSEQLMEFLVQLLGDQNFKIVLTTLTIINHLLNLTLSQMGTPYYIKALTDNYGVLSSSCLGRYVP